MTISPTPAPPGGRWSMLLLVCTTQVLGMAPWFAGSALGSFWREQWSLDAAGEAALTSAVQIGFVAGTALAVLLNLADVLPARVYVASSCALAGVSNAGLLLVDGPATAFVARFATGLFLAGVYPPAMKMVATWFRSSRGLAIGAVVGALILGKATPWAARAVGFDGPVEVLASTSVATALGALLVGAFYRDGPHAFARARFDWSMAGRLLRHRPTRLAIGGYLGHMWELYAMWTWLPAFVAASLVVTGDPPRWAAAIAWASIAAGAVGSVVGGRVADRWGRDRWVNLCMAVSGACCLAIGLAYGGPPTVLLGIGLVWGFFVVADSAQFSAMVTEVAPEGTVGTALTLQTSLGFLLTLITIQGVPEIAEAWGWRWAFPVLALGPAAGIACIAAWTRDRRTRRTS